MGKSVAGILTIMGGIGLIYLVASGNIDSAWRGVRGQCGVPEATNDAGGHAVRQGLFYPTPIGQMFVSDAGVTG